MDSPTILRVDSRFLIVNKPAGWLVHPTRPDGTFTLIDWLREEFPGEFLSLVSRLDRETSGLLLVARGKENASLLGKLQQKREIHKTYLAIVHGVPPPSGIINQPLDRLGKHRPTRIHIRQGVVPGTYPAITEFRTLGTRNHATEGVISLIEAVPKTGRLHQIRTHMEFIGVPVLFDKIYGKDDEYFINYIDKVSLKSSRHCLHSAKVSFGFQGEEFSFESGLPQDLVLIWDSSGPVPLPHDQIEIRQSFPAPEDPVSGTSFDESGQSVSER